MLDVPLQPARHKKSSEAEEDTYVYSLSEIKAMLATLAEPALGAVLTAAFTGLRKSELRGRTWGNYNGEQLSATSGTAR
jgi:integrase